MGEAPPSQELNVTKGLNRQPFGGPRAISLMSLSLGRSHRVQGTHQTIAVDSKIDIGKGTAKGLAFELLIDIGCSS